MAEPILASLEPLSPTSLFVQEDNWFVTLTDTENQIEVYNEVKESEQNPNDTREPYFVFGLIIWLLIWH